MKKHKRIWVVGCEYFYSKELAHIERMHRDKMYCKRYDVLEYHLVEPFKALEVEKELKTSHRANKQRQG